MTRLLINLALSILGTAIGLLAATILLPDFRVQPLGFVYSLLFFALAQAILSPLVLKLAVQYLPAFRGGIALVTVFVALVLTVTFTDSITIGSLSSWIVAPLIIWLASVVASIVLPMFLFKKALANRPSKKSQS
ncbi:MAG: hypothetical protein WAS27_00665 [Candidatus Saccharimonadales bacterium]